MIYFLKNKSKRLASGNVSKPSVNYYFEYNKVLITWTPIAKVLIFDRIRVQPHWLSKAAKNEELHNLIRGIWTAEHCYV